MATKHPSEAPLQTTWTRSQRMGVLAGVMLGILLSALDQTIVGTAMPRVIAQLQGLDRYAWVFTAYMLASTASMPIWGKLSDIYGRKPFYIGSMALFVLGSALSGAAQSMNQLILFRAIQGLGAGAMLPIAQAIIGDVFTPVERGKYQGLISGVFGLASVFGPTLGGYITDNLDWRWIFYVNLPVGIAAMIAVYLTLPRLQPSGHRSIDYLGAALLVAGIVPMLLGFTWAGSTYPWLSSPIVGLFGFSAVMLLAFIWVEQRATEPILPLSLFRNDIVAVSSISAFLAGVGMFGTLLFIALFVQGVLGQSATRSGAVTTPTMLGLVVSSIISGQLMSRWGRYRIISLIGLSIATVGTFLLSRMDIHTSMTTVVINMVIVGLGLGGVMPLYVIVVQNAVHPSMIGVATSSLAFFRFIGGTIGAAVLGSFLTGTFGREFTSQLSPELTQALPAERLDALKDPQVLLNETAMEGLQATFAQFGPQGQTLLQQLLDAIRSALAIAIHDVFAAGTVVMALAIVVSLFLREIPLRRTTRFGATAAEGVGGQD